IAGHDGGVRQRTRDAFEGREIKPVENFSVRSVKENGFIGIVAGDKDAFRAVDSCDAESGRISDVCKLLAAQLAGRNFSPWRKGEKLFGRDAAVFKFVHDDAVAGVARLLAEWVGKGSQGSVEIMAIEAKGEAEEIGLMGIVAEAIVGEV